MQKMKKVKDNGNISENKKKTAFKNMGKTFEKVP